jgi:hypothetical protein
MAIEKVVNVKVVDNVEATTKNVANLKTQLRQAQNEVNELSAKFGATSTQAVEAAKRAAQLKDAIGDAKALTDAFNPDAKFKALTSTLGGVAGGFAAVQGAVGLLGSESQSVEKAILKVQSAMAISQGVQAIGESVDSFKQLGAVIRSTTIFQKALSAATAVQTFVTNGATLAAKLLRGALISTGIGALVVGVGLLIANFDKVKKVVMTLIPGLSAVGDVVMSIVNTVTDFIGVTSEAGRSIDKMVSDSEKTLRKNQDFLDTQGDKYDEYTKRKIQANIDYAAKVKEVAEDETRTEAEKLKYLKDLRDKADREIFQADKDRQAEKDKKAKEEQDKIDAKNKEASDKRKEEAKRLKDEAKTISDNAKKANDEIRKTDLERLTEKYNAERSLLEKQNISTLELEIKFLNDKNELNLKQQEIEKKLRDEKIEADKKAEQDYWFAQSDAAVKRTEEDIAREKKVAEEKRNINALAIQSAQNVVSILAGLGEKNKKIQKVALVANGALSIAEIINNTNVGSSKEVATKGVFGLTTSAVLYAKMALSIGSVIAATAKGLSALGGGGSVGGSGSANGGGATQTTAPQFNIVGQSGTNQLAQTIAGQQNRPIEAFVVSSAVTTSQALDRNRVKTATFGG